MHVGIFAPTTDYAAPTHLLARACEERAFESFWVPEHTHIPVSRRSPFPGGGELPKDYSHLNDPFVMLAAAAAVTERINTTAANFSWWIAQGPVFTGSVGDEGMAAPLSRSARALWKPGTSEAPRKIRSSSV